MKLILSFCVLVLVLFTSCKDENENHEIEITRALKERELVFSNINKTWAFTPRTLTPESQNIATNWNEWRLFTAELYQKPKGTIGAFKQKTRSLAQKTEVLQSTIPEKLNKPQIKSRLSALITKIKALQSFMNFDRIPQQKVLDLITDLNLEVNAFQDQIEEIVRRGNIQLEEGEQEMLGRIKGKSEIIKDSIQNNTPPEEVIQYQEIK